MSKFLHGPPKFSRGPSVVRGPPVGDRWLRHTSVSRINIGNALRSGLTTPVRACIQWRTQQHDCRVSPNNSLSAFNFLVWQWWIKLLPYNPTTQSHELSWQASLYPIVHKSRASRDLTLITLAVAQTRVAQSFSNCGNNFKILYARVATGSKCYTEDPQRILCIPGSEYATPGWAVNNELEGKS
jgi:hypothetical protein